MKIKKFVAPTMPEAMNQIRKELGSDAVILNSKQVKTNGFLGFFKKINIEVVAGVDPEMSSRAKQAMPASKPADSALPPVAESDILTEIKQLKQTIEQQSAKADIRYTPVYQSVYQHLLDQEVKRELAQDITDTVVRKQKDPEPSSRGVIQDVEFEIARRIREFSFRGISYSNQIIHFVGPTGAGKTTTIAKVAAECMLQNNKKVAFITTDTYRIAAVEQLKTYARILEVPVEVAYTEEDYRSAINNYKAYDFIFVDTAGRNFREDKYIEKLKKITEYDDSETYLVLPMTAKTGDMADVAKQFQKLAVERVIFTKVDETKQYGSILNIVTDSRIGIAYLTNGQDVPEDLQHPIPQKISELIMGGIYHG